MLFDTDGIQRASRPSGSLASDSTDGYAITVASYTRRKLGYPIERMSEVRYHDRRCPLCGTSASDSLRHFEGQQLSQRVCKGCGFRWKIAEEENVPAVRSPVYRS